MLTLPGSKSMPKNGAILALPAATALLYVMPSLGPQLSPPPRLIRNADALVSNFEVTIPEEVEKQCCEVKKTLDALTIRKADDWPLERHWNASALGHALIWSGSTIRQCLDGAGGLGTAAGHDAAAVHNEQVGDIMGAMVLVHYRALRIIAHAAGTHQMRRTR
jgi:hypothetical protein